VANKTSPRYLFKGELEDGTNAGFMLNTDFELVKQTVEFFFIFMMMLLLIMMVFSLLLLLLLMMMKRLKTKTIFLL
jgi:hypothetical protein